MGDLKSRFIGSDRMRNKQQLAFGLFLVSPVPEISVVELEKFGHGFIVLACDGVWDVMNSMQVCQLVIKYIDMKNNRLSRYICRKIVSSAYKKGSTDNISCVFIPF